MSRLVRTVTGDVPPGDLGVTNYHEHLFQATPLLPGEELDDEAASRAEAVALRDAGTTTMVEATPIGLGRDPAAVARVSRGTGLRVVHTTGVHRHEHYAPGDPLLECGDDELEDLFRREIDRGIGDTGVRAGLVKAGVGLWSIGPFERRALAAAGRLGADPGVPAERVALAHVDRNPDPGLHAELAARGAYLGYDGAGRHQRWPDSVLVECLATTVAAGGGERILLGGDVARRSRYTSYGGMPGLAYLLRRFVPRVRSAVGDRATDLLLRDNPARWLAWDVAA